MDFAKPPAAGEGLESAVTLHVRDVPAREVLSRLARHLGLPWHVANEAVILGRPAVGNGLTVAVYDVGELVVARDAAGALQTDFEPLLDAILQQTGTADYGDWSQPREVGGKILPFSAMGIHAVVVRQVPEVHVQISQLLLTAFRRQCHARPGETDWRPSNPAGASAPAEPPGGKPGAPTPKPAGPRRVSRK